MRMAVYYIGRCYLLCERSRKRTTPFSMSFLFATGTTSKIQWNKYVLCRFHSVDFLRFLVVFLFLSFFSQLTLTKWIYWRILKVNFKWRCICMRYPNPQAIWLMHTRKHTNEWWNSHYRNISKSVSNVKVWTVYWK